MAWSYDESVRRIYSWFAKPNCLQRMESGSCKNIPTSGQSCPTCPSCKKSGTFGTGCKQEGGPLFDDKSPAKLGDAVEGVLSRQADGSWRIESPDGTKLLEKGFYTCKSGLFSVEPVIN